MRNRKFFCILLPALLAACSGAFPGLASRETASPLFALPIATAVTVTAAPQPQPTLALSPTATQPPATPTVPVELAIYQPALKPDFAADVALLPHATRYDLQVQVNPGSAPTLTGSETVYYTNNEPVPLDKVVFRLYPNLPDFGGSMQVSDVAVDGTPVTPTLVGGQSALHVPMRPALAPGASVVVTLGFVASVPVNTRSGYAVFVNADGVYALAGFYPTIPVYDSQGWNEEVPPSYGDVTFTDASFYRVRLIAPAALTAATSGVVVDTTDNGDGTRTWTAVGGPFRDFYLALAKDFKVVSQEVNGTQVNCYYRSGQQEGGRRALKYAADALHLFNDKFGPYPYAQLDVVPTPTNAGGIEYPGLIVVSQGLYNEEGYYFELVVAHEMAHQWWYGLVGSDQVDNPWMDEALANYCMYIYFQNTASPAQAQLVRNHAFEDAYRELQQNHSDRAVGGSVASFRSQSDYVTVVYGKGPLFFDAVRKRLGDDAFFAGLRTYLVKHRYGIAYPQDLISAFEDASGQQIQDLYRAWILGQAL